MRSFAFAARAWASATLPLRLVRCPELHKLPDLLADQLVRAVNALRSLELRKPPSVSETIDWARTLLALGLAELDGPAVQATLGVVLKHQADHGRARRELHL